MKKKLTLICAFAVLAGLSGCNDNESGIVLTTEQCCALYCARESTDTKTYICDAECDCGAGVTCGNGILDEGEECDRNELNNKECKDLIPGSFGVLQCKTNCTYNTAYCVMEQDKCGNGVLDAGEDCDGNNLNNKTCDDVVKGSKGNLACDNKCKFDTAACTSSSDPVCGNGVLEDGEECDGDNLNNKTCNDVLENSEGKLLCNKCKFDTQACVLDAERICGDGILEKGETCDKSALNGMVCNDLVPGTEGELKCMADCNNFDVRGCVMSVPENCGNGVLDPGEDCDGELLSGYTCKSILGPGAEGVLKCSYTCRAFDLSGCKPSETCGNGARTFNESCDPQETDQSRFLCSTIYGDATGSRTCSSLCRWETETCVPAEHCGNGIYEPELGEECDPALASSFTNRTCASELGPGADGIITCTNLCKISYIGCGRSNTCGDGILQNSVSSVANYHETCDSDLLNGKTCSSLGKNYGGTLKCLNNCTGYDFSDCHVVHDD